MKRYCQQLRRIWILLATSEALAVGMWAGYFLEYPDPALLILAVLFTVAPFVAPAFMEDNG